MPNVREDLDKEQECVCVCVCVCVKWDKHPAKPGSTWGQVQNGSLLQPHNLLLQGLSECGTQTSSISITWKLTRNAGPLEMIIPSEVSQKEKD